MSAGEQDLVAHYHEWLRLDRIGDYAQACAIAEAIRLIPDIPLATPVADTCEDIAKLKLDFWTETDAVFRSELETNPKSAAAWIARAAALISLDRFDEALLNAGNAVGLDPQSETAWCCLGIAKAESKVENSVDQALECFNKALEINPRSECTWFHKGMALSDGGRHHEALACFSHLVSELNPENNWAWYCQGLTLENLGRREAAEQSYAKAKDLASSTPDAEL